MKNIVILGSTGSIGENALRVIKQLDGKFHVTCLAVHSNYTRALEQAAEFRSEYIAVADEKAAAECSKHAPRNIKVLSGPDGLEHAAALNEADLTLVAVVGLAGLKPALAALRAGKDIALATKETLVAAGKLVMELAEQKKCRILPVDSEHSAVFQCLEQKQPQDVERIILTASGGPFARKPGTELEKITVGQALDHPRWNMGKKVSIDSATMMNKGLEIMEAHWLFNMPLEKIDVLIHPESIVHSMVEFVDGSMLAQMSPSDMRFAIQYALTWPERVPGGLPKLDLAKLGSLNFEHPDTQRFPCLGLARAAADTGGTMPAVLNAANEQAVDQFLKSVIPFPGIWRLVQQVMEAHKTNGNPCLEDIMEADTWARSVVLQLISERRY